MKLRISREELQARSLFIATPVYGGQPWGPYSAALDQLKLVMLREGLTFEDRQLFNESLITRGRNILADTFMRSGMTHTLLIDADIVFTPDDALLLLALADPFSDKDVICGAYPKKHISWKKVRDAAKAGFGDDNPDLLANFVGEFFFTAVYPDQPHDFDEPLEVKETGTGFMMVQRRVFERLAEAHPELQYEDDWTGETLTSFFNDGVLGRRYLSEDFDFCRLVRDLGMKVWIMPRVNLGHMGFYKFLGNIEALNAAATARHIKE